MKDSKIQILEAQRIHLIHRCASLELSTLHHSRAEGKWSVIQVLEHIVLSEEASVSYVFNKTQDLSSLKGISIKSRVYFIFMKLALKLNMKYKAPKLVNPLYSESSSLEDLIPRWEATRARLEDLSKLSPNILDKGILKHPYIGYLNFSQMLGFFSSHYAHHLAQINALVENK